MDPRNASKFEIDLSPEKQVKPDWNDVTDAAVLEALQSLKEDGDTAKYVFRGVRYEATLTDSQKGYILQKNIQEGHDGYLFVRKIRYFAPLLDPDDDEDDPPPSYEELVADVRAKLKGPPKTTQVDAAKAMGVSASKLSQWLNTKASAKVTAEVSEKAAVWVEDFVLDDSVAKSIGGKIDKTPSKTPVGKGVDLGWAFQLKKLFLETKLPTSLQVGVLPWHVTR